MKEGTQEVMNEKTNEGPNTWDKCMNERMNE